MGKPPRGLNLQRPPRKRRRLTRAELETLLEGKGTLDKIQRDDLVALLEQSGCTREQIELQSLPIPDTKEPR